MGSTKLEIVGMVITHILGGIGNQMFQYAAARALSLSKGQQLYLDVQDFEGYSLHSGFQLNTVFGLDAKLAGPELIRKTLGFRNQKFIKKLIKRPLFKHLRGCHFIMEPHAHYWPQIEDAPDDCYLYGYWQSEKYFEGFEKRIREDFRFQGALDSKNAALKNDIDKKTAVSVHVRRGDYVSDSTTSQIMHVCGIRYYEDAIRTIAMQVDSPHFYIFSDDMQWVRENLSLPYSVTYVDQNLGKNSYIDMRLMSACKHNIIANSSFSWWGAWLNPNPTKIVIAPSRWFINSNNDSDVVPSTWVRI